MRICSSLVVYPTNRDPLWLFLDPSCNFFQHICCNLQVIIDNHPVKIVAVLLVNEMTLFNNTLKISFLVGKQKLSAEFILWIKSMMYVTILISCNIVNKSPQLWNLYL